jgi:hypothetical protein
MRRDSGFGALARVTMTSEQERNACTNCPHQNDCANTASCLEDLNAKHIAEHPRQFLRLMTTLQATTFMQRLRAGETIRPLTNGARFGRSVCSADKFKKHCQAYPEWGAEAKRLASANAKAAGALKCLPKSTRTHCSRGHEFTD